TGHATDLAGNVGSVTLGGIDIDQVNPAIAVTLSPPPNASGWNNSPVTAHFVCSDGGSGGANCPADRVIATDGVDQTVAGTVVDLAGNTASVTSPPINID